MKKILVVLSCVLLTNVFAMAQENNESEERKNEIKVNLSSFLYLFPEIYYERLIADDQGLGASISTSLESGDGMKFMFMPYYRFYFQKERVSKFFIETNAALIGVKNTWWEYDYNSNEDGYIYNYNITDEHVSIDLKVGLGFAVGYKYVNKKSGIVGEIYAGAGRATGDYFYPRIGVAIGKQF